MSSEVSSGALPAPAVAAQPPAAGRGLALWVVAISHGFNHLQGNMYNVLYPVMMAEMGFGYFQIGLLTMAFTITVNGLQVIWGFFTPYVSRAVLLGCGNTLMAIVTAATGLVHTFPQLALARVVSGIGSSPQHPVGSTLLVGLFPQARGRALALHTTGGNAGTLAAPLIVGGMLLAGVDWRGIFLVVAVPSLIFGLAYFLIRERAPAGATTKRGPRATLDTYKACLRNRNLVIISLVQMVGAAGRGQGIDIAFLAPHFVNDFGISTATATLMIAVLQFGGLFGPLLMGWLSDRVSRKGILLLSLVLATLTTWGLAVAEAPGPLLLLNLLAYGMVVNSRLVITQALVADSAIGAGQTADAAFSLYFFVGFISAPIWTLIIGWIMENHGFTIGFSAMAVTYVAAIGLIAFIRDTTPHTVARG
jgi:FSR family fosmidomycin resistance protein-like MFS transporter